MNLSFLKIVAFVAAILGFFIWAGAAVTSISGESSGAFVAGDVSAETGRKIFFGKGKCSTCHSFGGEGSAIRCPNLGAAAGFDAPVGVRAATRKEELSHIEYIVESIYDPNAFVVPSFPKGLMKPINRPPISLTDPEITSVVLFLLENSGVPVDDAADVVRAQRPFAGSSAAGSDEPTGVELPEGNAEFGAEVFLSSKCWSCHVVEGLEIPSEDKDQGGVGPDLSSIGAIQTRPYLLESLIEPSAVVVADPEGTEAGSDSSYRTVDGSSRMPSFLDSLTVQQLLDLASYLKTLEGNSTTGEDP